MKRRQPWKRWFGLAVLAMGLLAGLVAGCGSGGDSGSDTADTGEVVIGLTDAEGDFLRYAVDVVSLELTRADGTVVETLPLDTRIDFAELTDLTEFVTAATVPSGAYDQARLTLDYSNAEIWVEDDEGQPVTAVAVDEGGTSLTTLQVDVQLSNRRHLVVAPGVPAHLTLDFDLAATHEVDTSVDPIQVVVHPVLVAEVNPERPKVHRIRGPLLGTDPVAETFVLAIHPFRPRLRDLGRLTVFTSSETLYEVNGTSAQGSEGFALLDAQPTGTAVIAVGDVNPATRRFRAREVYAGSSVPGGDLDALSGVVIAREGDTLTVRGAALDRAEASLFLRTDVTVLLDETTLVSKESDPTGTHDIGEVSVGQRVRAFGTFDDHSEPTRPTLAAEHVRLLVTQVAGSVTELRDGELDLTLQGIDGRRPALFDFTGTGATAGDDADPAAYTVDAGALSLASVEVGDPVRVFGFVSRFGAAPPDFQAVAVADASEAIAHLQVWWMPASANALTAGETGLILDLTGSPLLHHVFRNGIATELEASPAPQVVPSDERSVFAITRGGPTRVYISFADFSAALQAALGDGASVAYLSASGSFDSAGQVLTARRIAVRLR